MKRLALLLLAVSCAKGSSSPDLARMEARAANVTITRDDWGIAHVHGKTDADAVFGMIYAQAEDDFNRVERNYILAMGRRAEADGDSAIWEDLRMKLFIDPDTLKTLYAASPDSLKRLMDAWADGLNYFLHTHPTVRPRVIAKFEPWMALSFTEGSIGGDIESSVNVRRLARFYGDSSSAASASATGDGDPADREPRGSNGIAIAPSMTATKHAMLLINPHTSFYFRSELQMTSDEGLNAYGAVTWGQFFIYQGFNANAGWMHTSSGADNTDEYLETVTKKGDGYVYKYGKEQRPVTTSVIKLPYKTASGMAEKVVTVYRTHHGPIVKNASGKWVSVRLMNEPIKALTQSYFRTRTTDLASYRAVMELHTNSSNNTLFADSKGNIAYFHANFVPKRDPKFHWDKAVDGSNPATEWNGVHALDESPNVFNPANGWVFNVNDWPYEAAGPGNSPKASAYPKYMDGGEHSHRTSHALRVLTNKKNFTLDSLLAAAYDSYLPAFELLIPALLKSYDKLAASNPDKAKVTEQIELLRKWDYRWGTGSIETTIATAWADALDSTLADLPADENKDAYMATKVSDAARVRALALASDSLSARFGTWKTPWGEVNRFQRLTDDIVHPFDDAKPSIPVAFTSARWGSLASYGARRYKGSKKIYGTSGNSFVAVVEFGDSVRARAVTAGGESGDVTSKHFNDQAERYATGNLREVYFYPSQLKNHTERTYRPGK